jgi:hypothetical protein
MTFNPKRRNQAIKPTRAISLRAECSSGNTTIYQTPLHAAKRSGSGTIRAGLTVNRQRQTPLAPTFNP